VPNKISTSFRFTKEAGNLLKQLAAKEGIAKGAVLETLIRRRADELGLRVKKGAKL
jgi:hypothetical protein